MNDRRREPGHGTPDSVLLSLLADWLPHQRWFPADDHRPELALARREQIAVTNAGARVELVWVRPNSASDGPVFQVLLGWRTDLPSSLAHAVVGVAHGITCYDALHDQGAAALLVSHLVTGGRLGPLRADATTRTSPLTDAPGLVMSAEQSNTSIIYGDSLILKVFRRIEPGPNPDAELTHALTVAGCRHHAPALGEWTLSEGGAVTTVALATRYYPDAVDGWAMATASASGATVTVEPRVSVASADFADESRALGAAIGHVHRALADGLGVRFVTPDEIGHMLAAMASRARAVAARIPALATHLAAVQQAYHDVTTVVSAPMPVQRVHGDLHLGQCLRTGDGWLVIDFEGEPLRGLAERRRPQSPLKDIAGMLRSFDYAAHQRGPIASGTRSPASGVVDWAAHHQAALCAGYADVMGHAPTEPGQQAAVLRALQLDKAVYEVEYEHLHRPSWESIPLAAVARLAAV